MELGEGWNLQGKSAEGKISLWLREKMSSLAIPLEQLQPGALT